MSRSAKEKKDKLIRQCICKWNVEHNQLSKFFSSCGTDDIRGKACIRLDLSGESEIKKKWREAVINNLHDNPKSIKNLKCVNVGRHH